MRIIHFDASAIAAGKASFISYISAIACGASAVCYLPGMSRKTGVAMVAGSIAGCIESEMATRDQILNAVARSTHCTRSTVATILDELTGDDGSSNLWGLSRGRYFNWGEVERDLPRVLLAA